MPALKNSNAHFEILRVGRDLKARSILWRRSLSLPADRPVAEDTIVSFTSIPPRIRSVHLVVDSLLEQTVLPANVVLYLSKEKFPGGALPKALSRRIGERFSVRWIEEDLGPQTKLVCALQDFPERKIMTIDDDRIYACDLVEKIVEKSKAYPGHIVFRSAKTIAFDGNGLRRKGWPSAGKSPSVWHYPYGFRGILYPPGSLFSDVTRKETYSRLAPFCDDTWFKAMALLKGTPCVGAEETKDRDVSLATQFHHTLMSKNADGNKYKQMVDTFGFYGITSDFSPQGRPPAQAE